jgi:hypothetical protein
VPAIRHVRSAGNFCAGGLERWQAALDQLVQRAWIGGCASPGDFGAGAVLAIDHAGAFNTSAFDRYKSHVVPTYIKKSEKSEKSGISGFMRDRVGRRVRILHVFRQAYGA